MKGVHAKRAKSRRQTVPAAKFVPKTFAQTLKIIRKEGCVNLTGKDIRALQLLNLQQFPKAIGIGISIFRLFICCIAIKPLRTGGLPH